MPKFRKKPVVIEAEQLNNINAERLALWCGGKLRNGSGTWAIIISTLEGDHRADIGDWIIKGIKDEFYPCKPDIFKATYEPAE